MNRVTFLFDEHIPVAAVNALLGLQPSIRVRIVGTDPDVPPKGTLDPELFIYAEDERYAIVTFDKDTMPNHASDHLASGRHHWGVFVFPHGFQLNAGIIADELETIWGASPAEEWIDRTEYLPM